MKKLFLLFIIALVTESGISQVIHSNKIDSILNLVSIQSITRMNKELTGDTIANVGGLPQLIISRYWTTAGNIKAAQYIFEKFLSYGLNAKYMINDATNIHVYAEKPGTKYPNKKYIIGAHYDDIVNGTLPDTIYGADDNASGVCAVLEAARLLANMNLDYTIIFVAFDEEEDGHGMNRGSVAFADSLYFRGDTILGVLNADMIGYESDNNFISALLTDTNSIGICNDVMGCNYAYQLGITLLTQFNANMSDHQSFLDRGFKAFTLIEANLSPYWHFKLDRFSSLNIQYFYKMVKLSISTLLTWALDKRVYMLHVPLNNTRDTSERIAKVFVNSPFGIGTNSNAPRLYYKIGNGSYNFINSFNAVQDTFKFLIPGNPTRTVVSYYFALQDSSGEFVITLPYGGGGINPPGTTPPPHPFSYSIITTSNYSSNTVPKSTSSGWIKDTIYISQPGIVLDLNLTLNINHTNDGDLLLRLFKVSDVSNLSQFNGIGGQNYTNTIFDDSATISITQGSPPFSGRFKPQSVLSVFKGKELSGVWILGVFDKATGNTGTLLNWSLDVEYSTEIPVKKISTTVPDKFSLSQNYPNPFNQSTIINFQCSMKSKVILKVYDVIGREVATLVNGVLEAGSYQVRFDAPSVLSSGVYFYKIITGDYIETKKMVLIR